jgi:hypothetical protein
MLGTENDPRGITGHWGLSPRPLNRDHPIFAWHHPPTLWFLINPEEEEGSVSHPRRRAYPQSQAATVASKSGSPTIFLCASGATFFGRTGNRRHVSDLGEENLEMDGRSELAA